MIIDSRSGLRGVLVDGDTGQRVPCPVWANLATGEYEAYHVLPDRRTVRPDGSTYRRRSGSLRWYPQAPRYGSKPGKLVIPEDEPRAAVRVVLQPGQTCEAKGCHRLAVWRTGDAEELEPGTLPDGTLFQRTRLVGVHLYCDRCFRNPVLTSRRGVEREAQVSARPQ